MKKSSLTTAVLAGLAGLVGFAGSSSAVELNPDGTGQVLIYPYYTVNGGQQTYISVVNTSQAGKAVKVRFLEAYNSREVLDFNLFLSPYDVWTGTVFALADAGKGADGGAIGTTDNSCTVPSFASLPTVGNGLHYQPFSTGLFDGSTSIGTDTGPTDASRTDEGYVELIQMADVTGKTLADITHVKGVPPGCASADLRAIGSADFTTPTGGLFGNGSIINVAQGTLYPYEADAIDGFFTVAGSNLMSGSGSTDPSLNFAQTGAGTATAYVFGANGAVVTATYGGGAGRPVDAVSAVFDASALMNEWIANAAQGQSTDWVVTFPTKRFYVDTAIVGGTALPPFVEVFGERWKTGGAGQSCFQIDATVYDREEGHAVSIPGDIFSPAPEDQPPSSLCHEVNVISISDPADPISTLASNMTLNVAPYHTAGWMRLDLNPAGQPHAMVPSQEGVVFNGLPGTGFAAQRYVNNNVTPGVMSNYSGAFRHRVERNVSN